MFSKKSNPAELAIPPDVYSDGNAEEVLRAWVANNGLSVSLSPLAFGEGDTWGILLVDVARHVSRGLEAEGHGDYETNMKRIRSLFDKEWDFPTDLGTTNEHKKN